jgi:hypothetical protein
LCIIIATDKRGPLQNQINPFIEYIFEETLKEIKEKAWQHLKI